MLHYRSLVLTQPAYRFVCNSLDIYIHKNIFNIIFITLNLVCKYLCLILLLLKNKRASVLAMQYMLFFEFLKDITTA